MRKNIKIKFCFFCVWMLSFVVFNIASADDTLLGWAKRIGTWGSQHIGEAIVTDADGNVYTAGYFYGTVDFDPDTVATYNMTANQRDMFVVKLDSSGNFVWAKKFGGPGAWEVATTIGLDSSNNVYVTGYFEGTADFDPDPVTTYNLTSAGAYDLAAFKLDSSGNFVWAKRIGGALSDFNYSGTVAPNGDFYLAGVFQGTVDFDPGAGESNFTSAGNYDIFIEKLNSSGDFVWAKQIGADQYDYAYSTTLDSSGNLFMIGVYAGTLDVDPGPGTINFTAAGGYDFFIEKLDSSTGSLIWVKNFGGPENDTARSLITDQNGNLYMWGNYRNTVDFDPGEFTYNLTSVGSSDIFVEKLDPSGNFVWAKSFGGTGTDVAALDKTIGLDSSGNIYVTGYFDGTADFDPGANSYNLTSAGITDIFIVKLNQIGNFLWAKSFGGVNDDKPYSLDIDSNNNVLTTGCFSKLVDFDPSEGIYNLDESYGSYHVYILKLIPSDTTPPVVSAVSQTVSDNEITISWQTNEEASSIVNYGLTDSYGEIYENTDYVETHQAVISGLLSCTTYHYKVSSKDGSGNEGEEIDRVFTTTGCTGNSEIIGENQGSSTETDGGTVELDIQEGNIIIFVPPSATNTNIIIQAKEMPNDKIFEAISTPSLVSPVGNSVFNFSALSDVNTQVAEFEQPVSVTIPYTDSQVKKLIKSSLSIYRYDGTEWSKLNDCQVNGNDKTVTCTTNHFSIFALFGKRYQPQGSTAVVENIPASIPVSTSGELISQSSPSVIEAMQVAPIFTRTLRPGLYGDDVKELQKYLNTHNFPVSFSGLGSLGNETNYFGNLTKSAVILFQKSKNLIPDGIVGPKTKEEIK